MSDSSQSQQHDAAYKLLFSHQRMVSDLLTGFLARSWSGELDLDRLEAVSETHVSDDLRERRNDCVWRVPWRDPKDKGEPVWLYIYLLLEFQSSIDATMPVRMLTYLGLLYQDLLRSEAVRPDALPPVLPVVLYNGRPAWTAPVQIADCIPRFPAALAPYIPKFQYLFIDEGRMETSAQWEERNLAAAIFRIEQDPTPTGISTISDALARWLDLPEQESLRRALGTWIVQSVLPARLPGVEIPATMQLSEVRAMLGERLLEWAESRAAEAEARGEAHGLVTLIRQLVGDGTLTVDQGRTRIQALVDSGEIPAQAGRVALGQLG